MLINKAANTSFEVRGLIVFGAVCPTQRPKALYRYWGEHTKSASVMSSVRLMTRLG